MSVSKIRVSTTHLGGHASSSLDLSVFIGALVSAGPITMTTNFESLSGAIAIGTSESLPGSPYGNRIAQLVARGISEKCTTWSSESTTHSSFTSINDEIFTEMSLADRFHGMAAVASGVLINQQFLGVFSVGGGPIWEIRNGYLIRQLDDGADNTAELAVAHFGGDANQTKHASVEIDQLETSRKFLVANRDCFDGISLDSVESIFRLQTSDLDAIEQIRLLLSPYRQTELVQLLLVTIE
jgi:hypothetical protein